MSLEHKKNSCIVVDDKRLILLNIPKCASKSFKVLIHRTNQIDYKIMDFSKLSPDRQKYFKFAIIREPVERFLSAYVTILKKEHNRTPECLGMKFWTVDDNKEKKFIQFCEDVKKGLDEGHGFFDSHLVPQTHYLEDVWQNLDLIIPMRLTTDLFVGSCDAKRLRYDRIGATSHKMERWARDEMPWYISKHLLDTDSKFKKHKEFIYRLYEKDTLFFNKIENECRHL